MKGLSSTTPTSVIVAVVVSHSGSEVTAPDKLQATSLAANDFALFQLPQQYALDLLSLEQSWKALQRHAHPDMHAQGDASAQRLSMQWSVRINEAYQRLKNPIKRAAYLCELHGAPIDAETNTAMPADFLMQQINWREALDEAVSPQEVDALLVEVKAYRNSLLQECAHFLDDVCDIQKAALSVRALMFVDRFIQAVVLQLDRLESA
jgi:molecular chaperone HscB